MYMFKAIINLVNKFTGDVGHSISDVYLWCNPKQGIENKILIDAYVTQICGPLWIKVNVIIDFYMFSMYCQLLAVCLYPKYKRTCLL